MGIVESSIGLCTVIVDDAAGWLVTRFPDGAEVPATGNDDRCAVAMAKLLRYHTTWAMSRDHELTHSWLSVRRGLPFSPTLWAISKGDKRRIADELRWSEEADVLACQRLVQGIPLDADDRNRLKWCGDLFVMQVELRSWLFGFHSN